MMMMVLVSKQYEVTT